MAIFRVLVTHNVSQGEQQSCWWWLRVPVDPGIDEDAAVAMKCSEIREVTKNMLRRSSKALSMSCNVSVGDSRRTPIPSEDLALPDHLIPGGIIFGGMYFHHLAGDRLHL
jgi:hypothetical protein